MRQTQRGLQHANQGAAGAALAFGRGAFIPQQRLDQFQVPGAVLVPDEFVQRLCGQVEAEVFQLAGHFGFGALQRGDDPAVHGGQFDGRVIDARVLALGVLEDEVGGVPQLVAEVAVALDAAHVELDVAAGGGQRTEGEAQRVGAVAGDALGEFGTGLLGDLLGQLGLHHAAGAFLQQFVQCDAVDDVQRVEHVALGFGHLLALAIAHQTVHVDGLERNLPGQVGRQHDHPGDPEENDVETGDQYVGGVEGLEEVGLLGPAEGGEGPQAGAEPGVQHVLVLAQFHFIAEVVLAADFHLVAADVDVAGFVVPGRNAVAPPQLAADAPVLDVAHPAEVHVLVLLGHKLDLAALDGGDGFFRQRLGGDVPLVGQPGFDHGAGAVATRDFQCVVVDLLQQAHGLELGDDGLARSEAIHVRVAVGQGSIDLVIRRAVEIEHLGASQDRGVLVEDVDQRQLVALADFIVIEVVGRGDLHAAGAEFQVDVVVGDDGDQAVDQRQHDVAADQALVAFVLGMDRDGGIAEHGFRASGGDHQVILAIGGACAVSQRVAQMPEVALLVVVFHFQVGNGGMQLGVPVDQAFAAIDQAILVQAHKGFLDRFGQAGIHGEALARPVHGGAQAANLAGDVAAGFMLPFPDLFEKLRAAQVVAADALRAQLALDHHLRGDARMVGARLPQRVAALHAAEADQRVHDGVVEAMAHVQAAGDVRRRDHDGVGLARTLGREIVVRFPGLVPGSLDGVGLVGLVHSAGPLERLVGKTAEYKGKVPERRHRHRLLVCPMRRRVVPATRLAAGAGLLAGLARGEPRGSVSSGGANGSGVRHGLPGGA